LLTWRIHKGQCRIGAADEVEEEKSNTTPATKCKSRASDIRQIGHKSKAHVGGTLATAGFVRLKTPSAAIKRKCCYGISYENVMGEAPLVSVAIPVFNGEKYIREALDSAFAQTFQRFEVIVVDDGSVDRTLDIVAGYGERVQVVRQHNRGNASARNRAITTARGEWIAVLDADDRWDPRKLETQLRFIDTADVIYTAAITFGDLSRVGNAPARDGDCPSGDIFDELLAANFIPHSSVLIRTELVRRIGGYDETLRTTCDWDLWLRLSAAGALFAACREPLTHYRWGAMSVSKNHHRTCADRLTVVGRALRSPRGQRVSAATKRRVIAGVWETSAWFVSEQNKWTAIRWYFKAVAIWPFRVSAWRNMVRTAFY
jgi:glycosyltransferase involved in cell wall biosynthesis